MEDTFRFSDDFGPAQITYIHQASLALKAIVVIDNTARGAAIGGVRMATDVSVEECFRLARAMTWKNAAAGLPHGGGKSVIFADPRMSDERKEQIIRAFARSIENIVDYVPGPDMGTDERSMAWVREEIGRSVGLPEAVGGIPLDEIGATGFGLAACVDVAREFIGLELKGARVAVQGFGAVGKHAARFLAKKGCVLVAASDTSGAVVDPSGLDVSALIALKGAGRPLREHKQGTKLPPDAILDADCDIWIPAARPDVLRADNVSRLRPRLVPQGANIPCTPEAERILHERGVLVVPDFIANAGGVICAAMEYRGSTERAAFEYIDDRIRQNTRAVLQQSHQNKTQPRLAALDLARGRVYKAMQLKRWH